MQHCCSSGPGDAWFSRHVRAMLPVSQTDEVVEPIGLLFPNLLGADRSSVANPQLKLQLGEQTFEPEGMSAGFRADALPHATSFEVFVEVFGLFLVFQALLVKFARVGVHIRNLLEARVMVTTLYLVCICPIRSLCVSGGLDRDSAGGRSHP